MNRDPGNGYFFLLGYFLKYRTLHEFADFDERAEERPRRPREDEEAVVGIQPVQQAALQVQGGRPGQVQREADRRQGEEPRQPERQGPNSIYTLNLEGFFGRFFLAHLWLIFG